jgi:hypothetical protein
MKGLAIKLVLTVIPGTQLQISVTNALASAKLAQQQQVPALHVFRLTNSKEQFVYRSALRMELILKHQHRVMLVFRHAIHVKEILQLVSPALRTITYI